MKIMVVYSLAWYLLCLIPDIMLHIRPLRFDLNNFKSASFGYMYRIKSPNRIMTYFVSDKGKQSRCYKIVQPKNG